MSEIITDKLTGKTSAGNVTITSEGGSATMQLQQGLAKAWLSFNGTGTIAINDSFGMSSITDNSTGQYKYTMSSPMSNFVFATTIGQAVHEADGATDIWANGFKDRQGILARSTTEVTIGIHDGAYIDVAYIASAVLGDMA